MTALEIHLLKAYLDNELDEAATEAFELLLLERPDLAETVYADATLRVGLRPADQHAASSVHQVRPDYGSGTHDNPPASAASPSAGQRNRRHPWNNRLLPPALAASLTLALGVGAGYLLRAPAPMQPAALAYIDKLRNSVGEPGIVLPDSGAVVLLAPVAGTEPCTAHVSVSQPGRAPLRATSTADEYGYVSLVVPREQLVLGPANVEVRCGTNASVRYAVELVSSR